MYLLLVMQVVDGAFSELLLLLSLIKLDRFVFIDIALSIIHICDERHRLSKAALANVYVKLP